MKCTPYLQPNMCLQICVCSRARTGHKIWVEAKYRKILEQYNVARNIYNTDILYFFGREMYLWEREIHFELLYAGTNLECLYRGDSRNRKKLLQTTEQHL